MVKEKVNGHKFVESFVLCGQRLTADWQTGRLARLRSCDKGKCSVAIHKKKNIPRACVHAVIADSNNGFGNNTFHI